MSTRGWAGGAAKVAQVSTFTVGGTYADGQTYSVTINGKVVSYTSVTADSANADAAVGLLAALQASAYPEFLEITWASVSSLVISGTANTAGKPFTATSGPPARVR
jgi:roadblock/LC7 domain-containing protein